MKVLNSYEHLYKISEEDIDLKKLKTIWTEAAAQGETLKEYTRKDKDEEIEYKLPFGGGAGAGVTINPVAFLVIQSNTGYCR